MSMSSFSLTWLALTLGLAGCTTYHHPAPTEAKEALKDAHAQSAALQVPDAVQAELLPASTLLATPSPVVNERRFHVQAKEVEAAAFFASLMQDARYSVAVHPGVTGRISLDLKEVTLPEVLDTVASMYGFDIRRQGNVYHVYPAGLRTENFPVNYLMFTRQGASRTSITSGGVSEQSGNAKATTGSSSSSSTSSSSTSGGNNNGTTIETGSQSDFWKELATALQQLVGSGQGRAVIVNPQASLVTVRAMPEEMAAVKSFLEQSQQQLTRQVILEAKIVEVRLSEGYQQGVEWNNLSAQWSSGKGITSAGSLVALPSVTNTVVSALGGGAGLQFSDGNFDMVLNLLKSQGDVNTLSSPRVTATNNQKAVIKVGNDEYFVTNVSSNTVTSSSSSVVSPNIELTPFFSGVALDVLPQIDGDGNVLLHIHPAVIDVTEQQKTITMGSSDSSSSSSGTYTLPLAYSDIRESDTVVRAKSGDVIVIGGLMRTNKEQKVSKVPLLGDIPLVGEAFTNRQDTTSKTELVIMLKPQVVQADTWHKEIQRSNQLLEKWYPQEH